MNQDKHKLNYIDIIRNEFSSRVSANPRYSLRAFARDIEVSPAQLSLMLNGKKGISETSAQKIARALSMNQNDSQLFTDLVIAEDSKSKSKRQSAQKRLEAMPETKTLALDAFRVISDWYHFAILELTMLEGFKSNIEFIKKRLSLTTEEVTEAVLRLERLELLTKKNGKWVQSEVNLSAFTEAPSETIKRFHTQVLQKALSAIQNQSIHERELNTLMIGINSEDIGKYKKLIRKFHQDVNQLAESTTKNRTDVYCLTSQFFNLTKNN